MDRRLAVGMLGAATIGALATREARADDSESNPIARQLKGRRVAVWAGQFSYEGTVEMVADSVLYLKDVRAPEQPSVREVVVHMAACSMIIVAESKQE